ncbi:MAG: hypothetical protein IPL01_13905 [Acidobacteria bacterium]|nr:hypothetical protein [Acidobacteriota bacterium]
MVKDKVVVGVTGGDSASGYINAFEAKTGEAAWRFYAARFRGRVNRAPKPGEGESWKLGGGAHG